MTPNGSGTAVGTQNCPGFLVYQKLVAFDITYVTEENVHEAKRKLR